jgi:hypothetical protein
VSELAESATVTVATGTGEIVIVEVPVWLSLVAVIVAVPTPTPMTRPLVETVAIAGLFDAQVTGRVRTLLCASSNTAVS